MEGTKRKAIGGRALPLCVAPVADGEVCGEPAIAQIKGRHPTRHVCAWHADLAQYFYADEPKGKKENVVYMTARKKNAQT